MLPATRPWNAIRDLLDDGAEAGRVGDQVLRAVVELLGDADKDRFGKLAREPGVLHSLWVLMTLPAIARQPTEFSAALRNAGLLVSDHGLRSPLGFIAELTQGIEARLGPDAGTFSTIAVAALRQVLTERLGSSTGSLFETPREELVRTWSEFGTPTRFSVLAHDYLARFLEGTTQFYLSRELPQKLGPERRFHSLADVTAFDQELRAWCGERASIATEFAKAWLAKATFQRGRPSLDDARGFVGYALAKVGSEVRAHTQ